ncbi:unnamed protein product [Paramecium pentaurelia]|uniref:Carbohydrate-binding domain-containing protein n=1 Tax=Paramecium pentaurelia TaxID=43138 RepID=A0A8S1WQ67_9CILI|nr:unnamed protein product [Paramecium pentaurelia]
MILIFAIFIVILNAVIDPIIVENCKWGPTQYNIGHQNEATKENSLTISMLIRTISFQFIDAPLNECNDQLYKHDVDEFYIGTKKEYYVIDVSPNGALAYSTKINPNENCSNIITTYRQCDEISYFAEFFTPTAWNAHIELPISMFTQPIYANFFRANKMKDNSTHYMSYNPINSSPVCFHRPDKFIQLIV